MVKITKSASSSIDVVFEASCVTRYYYSFVALSSSVLFFSSLALCGVEDIVLCVESTPSRFHFDFEKRDQSSRRFVLTSSPLSLSLSNDAKKNSMLHRRRVRRRPDNGHDRAEVPTHRGRERLVVFTRFIIIIIIIHFSSCGIRFQRWCSKHRACGALRAPFSTPPRTRPRKERDERFSSSHPRVQNDDEAWWSFVEWVALSLSFARM